MTLSDELQSALGTSYTIERELASGGMSRVRCERNSARSYCGRESAPSGTTAEVTVERFTREIRLAARLQQANIVPLLTAGHTGSLPFYTMPFVDGHSLRQRLVESAPLPVAEAISIEASGAGTSPGPRRQHLGLAAR